MTPVTLALKVSQILIAVFCGTSWESFADESISIFPCGHRALVFAPHAISLPHPLRPPGRMNEGRDSRKPVLRRNFQV